jgi:hypothetical protein
MTLFLSILFNNDNRVLSIMSNGDRTIMALTLSSPILPTYPILSLLTCSFNLTPQRIQKLKKGNFFSLDWYILNTKGFQ